MTYRVEVKRSAKKFFRDEGIPLHVRLRVADAIEEVGARPRHGDKHLKGEYHCFWRRRVGDYRIVYRVFEKERRVVVVEICLRRKCY